MSVIEGQNDLDFVMPSQVEDGDLANQLEVGDGVQVYQTEQTGHPDPAEYDDLRNVIHPEVWQTTGSAGNPGQTGNPPSPPTPTHNGAASQAGSSGQGRDGSATGKHGITIGNATKAIYSRVDVQGQSQASGNGPVLAAPQSTMRQPAKKRKAARTERRGNGSMRQELSFSCDQCSLTFRDPQEAVKHISERHMEIHSNDLDDIGLHEDQVLVNNIHKYRILDNFPI